MKGATLLAACLLLAGTAQAQGQPQAEAPSDAQAAQAIDLYHKGTAAAKDWSSFLADSAAGQVSAAQMLGLSGDAVQQVENVKGVVLALKSAAAKGERPALGLSLTPARTALAPMNLSTYASGWPARLLGNLTLGYAQGAAEQAGQTFDRRAVSIDTSLYLHRGDDPVLAYAFALARGGGGCDLFEATPPTSEGPTPVQPGGKPAEVTGAAAEAVKARAAQCRDTVKQRWNASRVSLAYGSGRIGTQGGPDQSLGRTLALTFNYGFEQIADLRDGHSLGLTWRRASGEPVLQSLATGAPVYRDTRFTAARYTLGSSRVKALVEASNARDAQPTASETGFRRAVGLDFKIQEQLWVNLRVGKRRKIDGTGEENASLLNLSYSPAELLKP